ncbi:L-rhamnose isomerase / sugar isomerase [Cyclobacterium lianum]|uniref:L-rhamnose isomerase / sugar isomerase n=1 Tax=Cyclobacterium lianum TaxID=388280 RepID=A0A1M7HU03_9BACT|nr:TIM barrel protein [Cyclobacterium lianum]SHM31823.1 L-rhamnose isomerase / sugar isomerase [Cyclobacterium lianum]
MRIDKNQINTLNDKALPDHRESFEYISHKLTARDIPVASLIEKIQSFQIAIPSWALGTGGTRFGRFPGGGEPRTLEEKIDDVGLLHALNAGSGAISLHIPWDIPENVAQIKAHAASHNLLFDAVNSNTFQDQPEQQKSYKFGSLCHSDADVRSQAVAHNMEVIRHGEALGSKSLTVWLADGSSFPGQMNFRKALQRTLDSLREIYARMPEDWKMFIEYKPYEPYFYHTVIQDWGTSHLLASQLGERAFTLVDLGHHLPNTNIEQIVATLMMQGKLGGFHFNDSKFGDDDLTVGAMKPYQLFLIFNELVAGMEDNTSKNPYPAWMIDASHNLKDPLEDLLQSVEAIQLAYAQALLVDRKALENAREDNDPVLAQEILQRAFRTDVRPLVAEARMEAGAALDPLAAFRTLSVRENLVRERGKKSMATGL